MEFEPSVALWRSRGTTSAALDVSAVNGKDGSKLVLVTTRDEVLEYCTQSRKCVNHWTFRSNLALRLGAVRNPLSQVLYGVRGAKKAGQAETIVAWRNSDLEVAKWKTAALSEKSAVTGLYVHPQLTEEVVVVYETGKFALYDEDLVKLLDSSDVDSDDSDSAAAVDGRVVWASLASDHRNPVKGALFLSLLVKATATDAYELVVYQIFSKKDRKDARVAATLMARQTIEPPASASKSAEIASAAFHAETFAFSCVWSTGAWQLVTFAHDAVASTLTHVSSQSIASLSAELTAPASLTPTNKKRKLAAASSSALSGLQSCNVGTFSYLVVASASNPKALTGWDAKFGVQVAATELDFSSPEAESSSGSGSAAVPVGALRKLLSSLNGEVVVAAFEHAVFFVTVKNKHSTLASVLGASATAAAAASAPPTLPNSAINWSDVAAAPSALSTWKATLCSESATEEQFIRDLTDASVTATAAQFRKTFDAAVAALTARGHALSYRFLLAVTQRCVASEKLALWGPLQVALESKRISARTVPALLPVLMQHSQFALLELAIRDLSDIDERSVVRLLKFFIRKHDDKALVAYVSGDRASPKTSGSNKRKKPAKAADPATTTTASDSVIPSERFLVALLALPTNAVFLHHAIRELQLEDVLFLVALCKKLYVGLTTATDAAAAPAQKTPTALQLCSWICALVDGHFAQLVLAASKDAKVRAALESLDALVQRQLQSCEHFETVQSVLSNFLSGVKLPKAHGIPDYSIEELII